MRPWRPRAATRWPTSSWRSLATFTAADGDDDTVGSWQQRAAALATLATLATWAAQDWKEEVFHAAVLSAAKKGGSGGVVGRRGTADDIHAQLTASGALQRLSHPVLSLCLSFLGPSDLQRAMGTCRRLAITGNECIFDVRFREQPAEFAEQLEALRGMGLLGGMFDEDEVLEVLRETKGNVEHALALLFGEGSVGSSACLPRPRPRPKGQRRSKKSEGVGRCALPFSVSSPPRLFCELVF